MFSSEKDDDGEKFFSKVSCSFGLMCPFGREGEVVNVKILDHLNTMYKFPGEHPHCWEQRWVIGRREEGRRGMQKNKTLPLPSRSS